MLGDSCPAVLLPFKQQQVSAHHILPIVLPADTDQLRVMEGMRVAGIQTTIHYPPVHHLTWYRARVRAVELPRTEEYGRRELTLPLHPKLDERHVATVVQTLAQVLGQEGRHDTRRR
jgi:dTDP-4-amino-4,6-dideoxygalactose transaminase